MSLPLVSVLMPTYNRPEKLKKALESLSRQTYQNIEAVVVNDGGQEVAATVRQYLNNPFPISYISLGANGGKAVGQ